MKFSIKVATLTALAFLSVSVKADSTSDAIAAFCDGLNVTSPVGTDVVVAGQNATVTVTRVPNDKTKTITGLDLYSVGSDGTPKYVKNTWSGNYTLNTQASLKDAIPSDASAGLYYFRVWVTNIIDGAHGPDCIKTSKNFKVTTGTHTNAAGFISYAEHLNDETIYKPEHIKGCFGLKVTSPAEGDSTKQGNHVSITLNRDSASQTEALTKVDIYKKSSDGQDELVDAVWAGHEAITNVITLKDQIKIPSDKYDADAQYYYKIQVTSSVQKDETCTFQSSYFKIYAA
ncbi:hypothetical protein G6F57_006487 [Rhizopus arrhizus]|uniref:Uncharacterized protein n=1 Tax=Rhizopus oryzae TaxID=64495 RepID=A0A9P6XBR7_RHIOR|nr:hypothetical protein G6F30_006685 [Rhizopus arrhizus]KAG0982463.1 hypothetical protein G6F29_006275 [Rhizopus arrhizus]KAG0992975.1 hypothetical protein G6F28_007135 [Rhizopus arrhizus]KAG1010379.1 hypothetical protein G6F27_004716 [Rhizopus arrhizus]KAG1028701.1 hypothetical protein G6F26_002365 [Rhizopus arrhizus]